MPPRRPRSTDAARSQPGASAANPDGARTGAGDFRVVGLGASAGGLEALSRFFDALPAQPGMAFVVVQHLDPQHASMMAELLAGHTGLPVQQAADGMRLEPDRVFVIPPGAYLAVKAGMLRLSAPRERHGSRLPFDFLLESLAEDLGPRAIGVVLSGTGADGAKGLAELRRKGGFAIAQDPTEAAFDGMPQSAISAGVVDRVLAVAAIPAALAEHARQARSELRAEVPPGAPPRQRSPKTTAGPAPAGGPGSGVAAELKDILALLRIRTPHRFDEYKHGTLQRRIERRMGTLGIANPAGYLERLRQDVHEQDLLAEDMLINVTRFFRDPKVFELLGEKIVPDLVAAQPPGRALRIWVPGCSTGEEVYSIAMLFLEAMAAATHNIKLQIFASDIDEDAVAQAREGLYPAAIEADVTPARLARFFTKEDDRYRVGAELRSLIVFTVQDLLADPPFSRLDLICCRNLLIYLQPEAQRKVLLLFHFALLEGGILVLGGAETVGSLDARFVAIDKAERIYRRVGHGRPGEVSLPIGGDGSRALGLAGPRAREPHGKGLAEAARRMLLDAYAPASVVIDRSFTVRHFSGDVDRYLHLSSGEPSRDLLGLAREGLRGKLRDAVRLAVADNGRVSAGGARVPRAATGAQVRIVVQPMSAGFGGEADPKEGLLLVSFLDEPLRPPASPRSRPRPGAAADAARVAELEQELEATRRELRSAVHDLEISAEEQKAIDEEAMSINEEFQSTNEELLTSKEELQSLNEELTALNSQLQETLERHRNTSDDLKNILDSAGVATLFLDRALNIRFFTPAMTALFKIIPGDIGRPLSDLSTLAAGEELARDAEAVLAGGPPIQQQIRTAAGDWFLRGILPYRTQDGQAEGVIVTYSDITIAMRAKREAEAARAYSESIINAIRQPLVVLDAEHRIVSGNPAFFADFGLDPAAAIGDKLGLGPARLSDRQSELPGLAGFLDRLGAAKASAADHETSIDLPGRGARLLVLHARWIPGERKILVLIDDITEQKQAAEALQGARTAADRANLGKSRFLASASHDLRQPLQTMRLLLGLLERKITEPAPLGMLGRLDDAVTAMADILDTLLDINEIESGAVRPNLASFPVAEMLARLEAEFGYHAQALGLNWRVLRCALTVHSDPRLLEQMIRNLLANAMKYTAKNAGRALPGRVLLGCRRRGNSLRIEVWDNGPGIAEEQLGAIFEEFYQVDNPARERRNGLGLGLSIVQRLADLLGHEVRVNSRLGKGSVFSIEVPIANSRPDGGSPPDATAPHPDAGSSRTILVVEDDPTMRELLALLLADSGYATATAADGLIALDMVTAGEVRPDLIVADFNLPNGVNGVQTVVQLRRRLRPGLPAIVLSGDIGAGTLRDIAANDCRHLAKPIDAAALLLAIRQQLETAEPAPAPAPQTGNPQAGNDAVAETGTTGIVHVIDDDPALAGSMRELLAASGYQVRIYGSCEAFLAANPAPRDGCLLLDERLPGMAGLELLRRLQAEGRGPTAIMMTGYGDVRMAVAAMRAGAVDFIEKPVARTEILAVVSRAMDQRRDETTRDARHRALGLIAGLTRRQREIMERVLAGHPSKNIAIDLAISQRTVENHRAVIMKKTGAKSIPELVRVALGGN